MFKKKKEFFAPFPSSLEISFLLLLQAPISHSCQKQQMLGVLDVAKVFSI